MDKIKEIGIKPLALAMAVLALLAGVLGVAGIGVGAIICGVLAAVVAVLVLLAFGDGGNDVSMLRHAAIGVAMGNAVDEVKEHANYITTSVDEDGIANALKHFSVI